MIGPEALDAIRQVARQLGELREHVVFIGGAVRGLLITDGAVQGSRATKDVDVITAGIDSRAAYYAKIHQRLRALGFAEDTSEGAPLCRWKLGAVVVDAMPPIADVLGFTNRWYLHAVATADTVRLPDDSAGPVEIRLITAPSFLATKLEAFAGRGEGDYLASHDIEDILAVIDGRPSVVGEVEGESDELRQYVADQLTKHLAAGLADAVPGHLAPDRASQARFPSVMCSLDRLRRFPRLFRLGEAVASRADGEPGATGGARPGPWRYEILESLWRDADPARAHLILRARLTSLGPTAGTVGDGREVHVEDAHGRRFPPLHKLTVPELARRGLPDVHDQAVPGEPFETCWVYELPREARGLRLLLPFDGLECVISERPSA